jgi:tRNA A37 threonylcarbamoyltransferase TsaD
MQDACSKAERYLVIPHPRLCTDNGAMIAAAAYWRYSRGDALLDTFALLEVDAVSDDRLMG